jgi:hypothetical protein
MRRPWPEKMGSHFTDTEKDMISQHQHDGDADDRIRERIERKPETLSVPWTPPNPDVDIWGKPKKKGGSRRKSKREFARWM